LHSSTWSRVEAKGTPPCARSGHSCTVVGDKYVVIFGGGSVSRCFNDVHVLDTQSMEWFEAELVPFSSEDGEAGSKKAGGDGLSGEFQPRAGHASVLLKGCQWCVVGGGNNTSACTDGHVLDLSSLESGAKVIRFKSLGELGEETCLSCEGASLVETSSNGNKALAFGGYNGKYLDRFLCMTLGPEEEEEEEEEEEGVLEDDASDGKATGGKGGAEGDTSPESGSEAAQDQGGLWGMITSFF